MPQPILVSIGNKTRLYSIRYKPFGHGTPQFAALLACICRKRLLHLYRVSYGLELDMLFIPFANLLYSLACPCITAKPTNLVVLDIAVSNFGQQHFHFVVKAIIVRRSPYDKSPEAENIANYI